MSERWNLRNKNNAAVSYTQFIALTDLFGRAIKQQYGESKTTLTVMSAPEVYSTFAPIDDCDHDAFDYMKETNDKNTLLVTDMASKISPELWLESRFVSFRMDPLDTTGDQYAAFSYAEFRGQMPQAAMFYTQGGDTSGKPQAVYSAMKANMISGMTEGEYYTSNGRNSGYDVSPQTPASSLIMFSVFNEELTHEERAEKIYAKEAKGPGFWGRFGLGLFG